MGDYIQVFADYQCTGHCYVQYSFRHHHWQDAREGKAVTGVFQCNERGHDDHYVVGDLVSPRNYRLVQCFQFSKIPLCLFI